MTFVYQEGATQDGSDINYRAPKYFAKPHGGATLVYTDDKAVAKAYKAKKVEVKPLKDLSAEKVESKTGLGEIEEKDN